MSHIMPASSGDTNPEISLGQFSTKDRELLAAVFEHETVNLFIHLDDCEDDACTGCDPQHLAEKAQLADCETLRAAREASHSESDRIAYALAQVLITHPGCCTPKTAGGAS